MNITDLENINNTKTKQKKKKSVLFKRKNQNEPVFDKGYEPTGVNQLRDNLSIPNVRKDFLQDRENFNENLQNYVNNNINSQNNDDKKGLLYRLKSIGANTTANVISTPLEAIGMLEGLFKYPFLKAKALYDGDTDREVFLPAISDNMFSKAGLALEEEVRRSAGINQLEDMDRTDQIINLGTMFVGPSAKAGEGLIKSAIKPGLQITKGAKLPTKVAQVGIQTGIPTGLNEASRYVNEQEGVFGNYTPKPEEIPERLVLGLRNNARQDKIYETVLQPEEKQEENFIDNVKNFGKDLLIDAAVVGGTIYGGRKFPKLQQLIKNMKQAKTIRDNDIVFSDTLGLSDKILGTVNTKSLIDNATDKGFFDKDTASYLYRDINAQTNNFFDTGIIYVGDKMIKAPISGQYLKNELTALSLQYPKETVVFNTFLNENRLMQNAIQEYNDINKTNYSMAQVLQDPHLNNNIETAKKKTIAKTYEDIRNLYKLIRNAGVYTRPLYEMSELNKSILDIGSTIGDITPQGLQNLKDNKTLFDLVIHLPGIKEQPNTKGFNKWFSGIFDPETYKNSNYFSFNRRSSDKTALDVAPFVESFETNFKNSIYKFLNHDNDRRFVKAALKSRDDKILQLQNEIDDIKNKSAGVDDLDVLQENNKKMKQKEQEIQKTFDNIKYLGEVDTNFDYKTGAMFTTKNPLLHVLNKNKKEYSQLEKSINASLDNVELQDVAKGYLNGNLSPEYIVLPEDGKLHIYKTDRWLGKIRQEDPRKASFLYSAIKGISNTMKSFVTGPMNRFFAPITTAYTATDQMIARNLLNKDLNANLSKSSMFKNALSAGKEAFNYKTDAQKLQNLFNDVKVGKQSYIDILPEAQNLQKSIQQSPITHIKATGANLQTRFPVNYKTSVNESLNPKYFVVNSKKTLNKLRNTINKSGLVNNKVVNTAENILGSGLDYAKNILDSMRDAPTLGIYKNLSSKFMKDGKLDPKKVLEISRSLERNTATGKVTPTKDKFGNVMQGFIDIFPYFTDMLSENLARGKQIGLKNLPKRIIDLFDNDVNIKTSLGNIKGGILDNDYLKASLEFVAIPVILASIWNHASQENEDAYNSLPKQTKNKGIVIANAINGQPIVLPMTQSLMWTITALREGFVDPIMKLGENKFNPKETFGSRLADTAELNWGISTPPALGLTINALGYRSPNVTELVRDSITEKYPLEKYKLKNANYSDNNEYYENGVFSAKQRAMMQTLFGNLGSAVTESIDQTVKNKSLYSGVDAFVNEYPKSLINLFNPKLSSWDETSGYLYKKDAEIKKLQHIPEAKLTQEQKNVRYLINMYQNSRLNEIQKQIKALNREITEIRNTGKSSSKRKANINELIKKQKLLRAYKVKAYEQLDTLLKQSYGITYDDYMKGIKQ